MAVDNLVEVTKLRKEFGGLVATDDVDFTIPRGSIVALIGALVFVVLQDYVSSQTENWMSFVGLVFVLVVMFFPRGVLGIIRRRHTP